MFGLFSTDKNGRHCFSGGSPFRPAVWDHVTLDGGVAVVSFQQTGEDFEKKKVAFVAEPRDAGVPCAVTIDS